MFFAAEVVETQIFCASNLSELSKTVDKESGKRMLIVDVDVWPHRCEQHRQGRLQ